MTIHSNYSLVAALVAASSLSPLAACAIDDKVDQDKGVVDDSPPPGTPMDGPATGKSDGSSNVIAYVIESPHPYTNNLDQTYTVDLATVVPSCASQVKVHFAMLRTEAGYDYVSVVDGNGTVVQTFDGAHDNVWSDWATLSSTKRMSIRLETDYSIVRDGFRVDAIDWAGSVICPAPPVYDCGTTGIDLRKPAPACGCEEFSHCTPLGDVVITHSIGGGFTGAVGGKRSVGLSAYKYDYAPSTGEQTTLVGSLDDAAFREFALALASSGVLYGPGRADSSNWTECFNIVTDQESVSYCAPAGSHDALIADFIARFEALMSCPDPLACGDGYSCQDGSCAETGCVCSTQYDPVCGVDSRTYSNGCTAACAGVDVKHDGECGITGDACGTFLGLVCLTDYKCRYGAGQFEAPYPDAGGYCVSASYCDAPPDCEGLPHIAVPGVWGCVSNLCQWQAGEPWTAVSGWRFETAHPYANNVSTWKQLYLPSGATRMRLAAQGTFDLESNYDFLEVWTWTNGAWSRVVRYTGTTPPAATDVFPGQYHYLKFVTDSSVTRYGFAVTAQYRNL